MTAAQLKILCKEYGLKVSGKKSDLKERLREHLLKVPAAEAPMVEFHEMSDEELQQTLAGRGMEGRGDRATLLKQISEDIQFMHELSVAVPPDSVGGHKTITEALQAVALEGTATEEILASIKEKSMEKPKFVDVTIRTLGMEPLKHTAGGAPSVTADVLRQLAGDPFDEPPKYGLVSTLQF